MTNVVQGVIASSTKSFFLQGWTLKNPVLGSLLTGSQDGTPIGVTFKPNGKFMYVAGSAGDSVYRYELVVPWDIGSAQYSNNSVSVTAYATTPSDVAFNDDGSSMFVVDLSTRLLSEWTLGTPWDLNTATFSTSTTIPSVSNTVQSMKFKLGGTKMYVADQFNDTVLQYSLSTPWDISTISYDSKSKSLSSSNTSLYGIDISADGTTLYAIESLTDEVHQWTMSTAWDISTATDDSIPFSITNEVSTPYGIVLRGDGSNMYVVDNSSNGVYQYRLTTPWDLSTAEAIPHTQVFSEDSSANGFRFSSDGTKAYLTGNGTDTIYQYSLTEPFDLSTISYDSVSKSTTGETTTPQGLFFKPDGTRMYICDSATTDSVYQYNLGAGSPPVSPWDVSSATHVATKDVSTETATPKDVVFKPEGTQMYVLGTNAVWQYTLTIPWNISSASYASKTKDMSGDSALLSGIYFKPDGTAIFAVDGTTIYRYALSTAWDISTATLDTTMDFPGGGYFIVNALDFNDRGTRVVVVNYQSNSYQFDFGPAN